MKTNVLLFWVMLSAAVFMFHAVPANALSGREKDGNVEDSLLFASTVQTMKDMDFVIEAERIMMPDGASVMVSSVTNFISVQGENAVIQISPMRNASGANGVGGLTVEGGVDKVSFSTDRRGNFIMTMTVIGANVSASLTVTVPRDSNRANVRIDPNYNSDDMTMTGTVLSSAASSVHKGISRY